MDGDDLIGQRRDLPHEDVGDLPVAGGDGQMVPPHPFGLIDHQMPVQAGEFEVVTGSGPLLVAALPDTESSEPDRCR